MQVLSDTAPAVFTVFILIVLAVIINRFNNRRLFTVHTLVLTQNPGLASTDSHSVNHRTKPPGLLYPPLHRETGIFSIGPDKITFLGYRNTDRPVKYHLDLKGAELFWIGRTAPFSRFYWFLCKRGDEYHYFSAETGRIFSGNKLETRNIFDRLLRVCENISGESG